MKHFSLDSLPWTIQNDLRLTNMTRGIVTCSMWNNIEEIYWKNRGSTYSIGIQIWNNNLDSRNSDEKFIFR
jgi:hypothetical protein